jgi:hypothetical protein
VIAALDATYSAGSDLSGVGVYSRELLDGLASAHPESRLYRLYRSHKLLQSSRSAPNTRHGQLTKPLRRQAGEQVFRALDQRMPRQHFRQSVCTFDDLFVMTREYSSPEFRADLRSRRVRRRRGPTVDEADRVLSGFRWSSVGQLVAGVQYIQSGSKAIGGPTIGSQGISVGYSWSRCFQ